MKSVRSTHTVQDQALVNLTFNRLSRAKNKTGQRIPAFKKWFVCHFQIFYAVFLVLFAITLMTDFYPETVSIKEYVIYVWVFTLCIEEGRQVRNTGFAYKFFEADKLM